MFKYILGSFIVSAIVAMATSSTAQAESFTETFTDGVNTGGWSFNGFADTVLPTGGNPGAWLSGVDVDTFGPNLGTAPAETSPFVGDYVAGRVDSISLDARSSSDFNTANDPAFSMTLVLRNGKGTPFDPFDDDLVYYLGDLIPQPSDGWKSFSFAVPFDFAGAGSPVGWGGGSNGEYNGLAPGVTYGDVLRHVTAVEFLWLDPQFFAIFQQWDVGADNITINRVPEPSMLFPLGLLCFGWFRRGTST